MINATLEVHNVPIGDLRPDPFNPRRMPDDGMESLTRSIQEFGFVDPIIARREDRSVIGGHQRLVAARRLGLTTIPVIFLDITVEQAKLLNLTLNKVSGSWDEELLARLLAELRVDTEADLALTGFHEDEIAKLLKTLEIREKRDRLETFDLDQALRDAQARPVAKRGELWRLGDHRLLCGDSTNPEDAQRLMDGHLASLMATDPPYLVDYQGGSHPASKANKGRANKDKHWDEYRDPETSVAFFRKFLTVALEHLVENAPIYQWYANLRQTLVETAWQEVGLHLHQVIIWAKSRPVLTRSHYLWQHEPCMYGWRAGKSPKRKPPESMTSVWQVDKQGDSMGIHPTQKPVELFLRPISYHTEPNDVCYEPFLGSGTALIACERLGRRCYAIEQEPSYVDIAIRRWEAFSDEKAEKVSD